MQFQIPKQTDEELIRALAAIKADVAEFRQLTIDVVPFAPGGHEVKLPEENPTIAPAVKYITELGSQVMPNLRLRDSSGGLVALLVERNDSGITDKVRVPDDNNWANQLKDNQRGPTIVRLIASARKHLRAIDADATLNGGSDSAWSRYRDSQVAILNSLQQTQKTIITEFSRKITEAENAAQKKLEEKGSQLDATHKAQSEKLEREYAERSAELDTKAELLDAREKSFNTKEARYVARQRQEDQIEQIKGWLEKWSLTKGTQSKRRVVAAAYVAGIIVTGILTFWLSWQNVQILKAAESDLSRIQWWEWVLLSLRSLAPLAGLLTFVTYFIRWSTSWARQHAEEEFRNRARVLDIGRTAWLLEAVRDAQDNQKELPSELIKELSRNLFVYNSPLEAGDIDPQSFSDLILHGLSSLRLRTPDGTELEAKRKGAWPRG